MTPEAAEDFKDGHESSCGQRQHALVPELFRVSHILRETRDVFTLVFDLPSKGFRFLPGQFNMLYVFGVGEVPISISGDPEDPTQLVHSVRAVGRVTSAMAGIAVGEELGVRGPFGKSWPLAEAEGQDLLIVAGGIGLAPLRPVVLHALRFRSRFARVSVVYGARTPADLLFREEVASWARGGAVNVEVVVERGDAGWAGHTGVVTKLLPSSVPRPASTLALLCGPEIMLRFAARQLEQMGVDRRHLYVSLERNMQCGVGLCGHCQLGPYLLCRDGAPLRYDRVVDYLTIREL